MSFGFESFENFGGGFDGGNKRKNPGWDLFPEKNDTFSSWEKQYPDFSPLANDPYFRKHIEKSAINKGLESDRYLGNFTDNLLKNNPNRSLSEIANSEMEKLNKIKPDLSYEGIKKSSFDPSFFKGFETSPPKPKPLPKPDLGLDSSYNIGMFLGAAAGSGTGAGIRAEAGISSSAFKTVEPLKPYKPPVDLWKPIEPYKSIEPYKPVPFPSFSPNNQVSSSPAPIPSPTWPNWNAGSGLTNNPNVPDSSKAYNPDYSNHLTPYAGVQPRNSMEPNPLGRWAEKETNFSLGGGNSASMDGKTGGEKLPGGVFTNDIKTPKTYWGPPEPQVYPTPTPETRDLTQEERKRIADSIKILKGIDYARGIEMEKALKENRIIINKSLDEKVSAGQFDSNPIFNPKRLIELSPSHVNQLGINAAWRYANLADVAATISHEEKHKAGPDEKVPYQGDIDLMTRIIQKQKNMLNSGNLKPADEQILKERLSVMGRRLRDTVNRAREGYPGFKKIFPEQRP